MRLCDYLNLVIHLKHRFEGFVIYHAFQRVIDVPEVMNELLLECGTIALFDGVHHAHMLGDDVYTIVHPLIITALDAEGEAAETYPCTHTKSAKECSVGTRQYKTQ